MGSQESSVLKVRVQPRASANQIVGWRDGMLCVRITAPPVEGEANEACVRFLAEVLGVRRSQVRLVSGHRGREKTVAVDGLSQSRLDDVLKQVCPK